MPVWNRPVSLCIGLNGPRAHKAPTLPQSALTEWDKVTPKCLTGEFKSTVCRIKSRRRTDKCKFLPRGWRRQSGAEPFAGLIPISHWAGVVILYLLIKSNGENETAAALSCLLLCDSKVETVEWIDWAQRLSAPWFCSGRFKWGKSRRLIRRLLTPLGCKKKRSTFAILIQAYGHFSLKEDANFIYLFIHLF